MKNFGEILNNIRLSTPLVHNITNYVTVNDCANILLACGGSPIMADDIEDVEDITSLCDGLNINIGTLNYNTVESMIKAGKKANELAHPVILDPVGVGASRMRNSTALRLIDEIKFSVIKGNISEIKSLALGSGTTKGVDADVSDAVSDENIDEVATLAKKFASATNAVVAVTGAIDVVADGDKAVIIRNGHPMMTKITGAGCMLSAMLGAFVSANTDAIFDSVVAGVAAMGLCGEIAMKRMTELDGNSSYRNYLIDAVFNLDGEALESGARYEMR